MAGCDVTVAPQSPVSQANRDEGKIAADPNALSYGNGMAEIAEFAILDDNSQSAQLLHAGLPFSIRMKVLFHSDIQSPIFAFTIKDIKGLEITGTNTYYKKIETGSFRKGESATVVFTQSLNCQSGNYSLSLGCTGMTEGRLDVYHRLYDVLLFEAVSAEPMVGFFDLGSRISVERV
jgi:teichoic acid transport system ATP-binding protein